MKRTKYCVHGQGRSDGLNVCQFYVFHTTHIFAAKLGVCTMTANKSYFRQSMCLCTMPANKS